MKNMKTALSAVLASAMIFGAAMASAETYSASAKGFGGDVTVTVTVEDGKIAAAEAAGISETPGAGRRGHAAALRSDRRESDAVCRYRLRRDPDFQRRHRSRGRRACAGGPDL